MDEALAIRMEAISTAIDAAFERRLAAMKRPDRLAEAMRHAAVGGGKRIRPFLVIESAALFGVPEAAAMPAASALEAVHVYSLIHDDLPAMDDDDLRRGKPTLHRAFDEATAILAGDALLTLAFAILAEPGAAPDAARQIELVAMLAAAAGHGGMVGGQMLDLAAEGRYGAAGLDEGAIRRLQSMKTGALIRFACLAGATLASAGEAEKRALRLYSEGLGLAFQIKDDLLDVEGEAGRLGKAVGKDAEAGKATFVGLLGVEGARRELALASEEARAALAGAFGNRAGLLAALLDFNAGRAH